ncbi:hypothetical protein V8G54_003984 [Vigna mungo]|uniref:Uncharacterized protein n=1 Tax=Vigna mungo TaxID=3915 RepID=A0AAQ3PBH1_VIGMU
MDSEEVPSAPSTPATPGAPLFGSNLRFEKPNVSRKSSFLRSCKCFSTVEQWTLEDGPKPRVSCSLPSPPIPLAKKVSKLLFFIAKRLKGFYLKEAMRTHFCLYMLIDVTELIAN